ncbi:MAG: HdeD family acid-resistance protein [Thermoleophilia bacterium]
MSTHPGIHMGPQTDLASALKVGWKWLMGIGVALVLLGAIAIIYPVASSVASTLFIGSMLVIGGVIHAVYAFSTRGSSLAMEIVSALIYLVVGFMILAEPISGVVTLTLFLALFFVAQGIFNIVISLARARAVPHWGWMLFNGLISLGLGVVILAQWPEASAWVIGLLVGIYLLFDGWALMMLGWLSRGAAKEMTS